MSNWNEPKSDYVASDEVLPGIFNELAENEKYLKEVQDTKITTNDVKNAVISSSMADSRINITDNEILASGFSKIRKWINDLKLLAFLETVDTSVINNLAVTTAKIADSAITTAKIRDANVSTAKLKDSSVTASKIADGQVQTSKIADGAVTNSKIHSISGDKVTSTVNSATNSDISTLAQRLKYFFESKNDSPSTLNSIYQGIRFVEIANSTIGLVTGGNSTYSSVLNITPSSEYDYPTQLAFNSDGGYMRRGTNASSWSAWIKILNPNDLASIESDIETNRNNINNITNGTTIIPKAKYIVLSDKRSVNMTPEEYMNIGVNGLCAEFKTNSTIGLTSNGVGTYSTVIVVVPWGDSSGGYPTMIAINSGGVFYRIGTSNTTWGVWNKLAKQSDVDASISNLQTQINNMLNGTTTFTLLKANTINLV